MKWLKKWLVPLLTGLLAVGAAILPQRLSQARDAQQFGHVHTEELNADAMPTAQPLTLLDRMELYSRQQFTNYPILSSRSNAYFEDSEGKALAQTVQEQMTEAGILPNWIFQEEPFDDVTVTRILLWDPEGRGTVQEPSVFFDIDWSYFSNKNHQKSINVTLDAETGLPIRLFIDDTNMSQWLPYETEDLRALAERFFGLLEVEVRETDSSGPMYVPSLNLSYVIAESSMSFHVSRHPVALSIMLEINLQNGETFDSSSASYDG